MTDREALDKARAWFGPDAVARIGTEHGGADERYVGVEQPGTHTIYCYGMGRTWEECFASVPTIYRPTESAANDALSDAILKLYHREPQARRVERV